MSIEKKYRKKTILQVVPALISGGVERGTLEIAQKIAESGNISIVISSGGGLVDALKEGGSEHIKMNVAGKNPIVIWRNINKIAQIIRERNVDILHVRSRAPAWSCYFAAKATGIKLLTTFHGIYNFKTGIKKYYNSVMSSGVKIIAVSNFVKEHIIEKYNVKEDRIEVIHRGVNYKEFSKDVVSEEILNKFREKYNVPHSTPVILLAARATRWKGHLFLIEALAKIRHLNFYCIMAGDLAKHPGFVDEVNSMIQEYKIQNRVQLFGNEPNMLGLYAISDIVVSASIQPEAFGRTVIEAQSMEKLVIATNIGGACETIQDKVTGFHVKAGDSSDLAAKIEYCLSIIGLDEALKITSAARKSTMKNFSLDRMIENTLSVYDEI